MKSLVLVYKSFLIKKVQIKIKEIKKPEGNAQIIAQNIAKQLQSRGSFRRTMKMAISKAMQSGVQGVKVKCSGRLAVQNCSF